MELGQILLSCYVHSLEIFVFLKVTVDMDMIMSGGETMCTKEHTGTSASAPIAAGICALALEAK